MSEKNKVVNEGIQANSIRAEVLAVGHGARAIQTIANSDHRNVSEEIVKILVVFANPLGTDILRLGKEDSIIHQCIKRSLYRDKIHIDIQHAASIHDLRRALLEEEYRIVHFSGHGTGSGLSLENEDGDVQIILPDALASLLSAYAPPLECVILNACYSNIHSNLLLSLGVPYTIATEGPLSDDAAIEFTRGFYDAVGAGKSIKFAHEEGCRAITLAGYSTSQFPILLSLKK